MSIFHGKKTFKTIKGFFYQGEQFYIGNLFDADQDTFERFEDCLESLEPSKKELSKKAKEAAEERQKVEEKRLAKEGAENKENNDSEANKGELVRYKVLKDLKDIEGKDKKKDDIIELTKEDAEKFTKDEIEKYDEEKETNKENTQESSDGKDYTEYVITKNDYKEFKEDLKAIGLITDKKITISNGTTLKQFIDEKKAQLETNNQ